MSQLRHLADESKVKYDSVSFVNCTHLLRKIFEFIDILISPYSVSHLEQRQAFQEPEQLDKPKVSILWDPNTVN